MSTTNRKHTVVPAPAVVTPAVANSIDQLSPNLVRAYLKANPQFVDAYVLSNAVTKSTFNRWASKRAAKEQAKALTRNHSQPNFKRPLSISSSTSSLVTASTTIGAEWKSDDLSMKRRQLLDSTQIDVLIFELANACAQLVDADSYRVYATDGTDATTHQQDMFQVTRNVDGTIRRTKPKKTPLTESSTNSPSNVTNGNSKGSGENVLTQTLIDCSGTTIGLIEINRSNNFDDRDRQFIKVLCTWASSEIYYAQAYESMNKQRILNDFLLTVARSIFQDIVSMDTVIMKVMNFAQKLVSADRASLFLVDAKTNELYARIFDVGTGPDEHGNLDSDGRKEIRFPIGKGIAGTVASNGQGLNIENAYNDSRFNSDVDSITGYTTKTILCMPIFIRGNVIGVVQMVNKQTGVFTIADEESFETFAIYCGLALHHAKLYDKIRRSEQKYRVALEVLAYHSVCNKDEVNKLKRVRLRERIVELETFDFNGLRLSELEKPLYAVYMFVNLFNSQLRYDYDDLVRFVLTVRKNYRRVPYHNWTHGWSVAHAMFVVLKMTNIFTPHEAMSMYVACLCHDLDHRGKNNAYMKTMSTPLAAIYSTSVMEHHHFNQTVTILQQDGHNLLKSMSSEQYKQILSCIKHCILATDLALFFPNKAKMSAIVAGPGIDWTEPEQRSLAQAILMTACDLIASAKPWQVQTETVKVIFEEFYEQGDAERVNGREPIPMMDRHKAHELPQMQVGFMRGICLPCYELVAKILPSASDLLERCSYNANKWQELADEQKTKQTD